VNLIEFALPTFWFQISVDRLLFRVNLPQRSGLLSANHITVKKLTYAPKIELFAKECRTDLYIKMI